MPWAGPVTEARPRPGEKEPVPGGCWAVQTVPCYTSHGTPSALALMLLPSLPPAFLAPGSPGLLEVLLPEPEGKHRRADQLHMQREDKVISKGKWHHELGQRVGGGG